MKANEDLNNEANKQLNKQRNKATKKQAKGHTIKHKTNKLTQMQNFYWLNSRSGLFLYLDLKPLSMKSK